MERILHRGIARREDDGTIILRDQIRLRIINSSEYFDGYCDACKSDERTDKRQRTYTYENSRVKFIVTRITIKSSRGREIASGVSRATRCEGAKSDSYSKRRAAIYRIMKYVSRERKRERERVHAASPSPGEGEQIHKRY